MVEFLLAVLFLAFFLQYSITIISLYTREFKTKKDVLLNFIPLYFLVLLFTRFIPKLYNNFKDLK